MRLISVTAVLLMCQCANESSSRGGHAARTLVGQDSPCSDALLDNRGRRRNAVHVRDGRAVPHTNALVEGEGRGGDATHIRDGREFSCPLESRRSE